jgi:uncharacterized protein (DUF983 family)
MEEKVTVSGMDSVLDTLKLSKCPECGSTEHEELYAGFVLQCNDCDFQYPCEESELDEIE